MNRIVLFGGTTEGRKVTELLKKLPVDPALKLIVCVATDYGKELLQEELKSLAGARDALDIRCGRMDETEMKEFLQNEAVSLVLDATHPYAQEATRNIKNACKSKGVDYIRILREDSEEKNMQEMLQDESVSESEALQSIRVASVAEAVRFLEGQEGNILIATGSKELEEFTKLSGYKSRCYARVLSTKEAVEKSVALGFQGAHLVAMQGPFSKEMNIALLRQIQAAWFVTKESGAAGGFAEKAAAAKECGVTLVQIEKPGQGEGMTVDEAVTWIVEEWLRPRKDENQTFLAAESAMPVQTARTVVTLIGIGAGHEEGMTREAEKAMCAAELVCGAGRMLMLAEKKGLTVKKAYLPDDILKALERPGYYQRAAVLLSGDVSFFSGAKKLAKALRTHGFSVQMLPGISSVSCLAAKIQKEISGADCVSLHGRSCNVAAHLRDRGRIFLLIDKIETIQRLCKELSDFDMGQTDIWIGSRLSYPDEQILKGKVKDFTKAVPQIDDLSTVYIEDPFWKPAEVFNGIADEEFIRGKIPMTKKEVRCLSLSALGLTRNAVVYDIGAGTGSVAVEAARAAADGCVYAIERETEGISLIEANRRKFRLSNLHVIQGEAPEVLAGKADNAEDLPVPTHVFIGGSGGYLEAVLDYVYERNPHAKTVINAITPETLGSCLAYTKRCEDLEAEVTQVQCARSRAVGNSHLMTGLNPVWIISIHNKNEK